jgi:hypothetical protein
MVVDRHRWRVHRHQDIDHPHHDVGGPQDMEQKPFFKLLTKQEVEARRKPAPSQPSRPLPDEAVTVVRFIANIIGLFI